MGRLRQVQWLRALTLWGCAALFTLGIGWAITTSDVLMRMFWVTFPAVVVAAIAWCIDWCEKDED